MVLHLKFCNMEPIHGVLSSCFQRGIASPLVPPSSHVHMFITTGSTEEEETVPTQQCYSNNQNTCQYLECTSVFCMIIQFTDGFSSLLNVLFHSM